MEEWKQIEELGGIYYISNLGRVRRGEGAHAKIMPIVPNKNRRNYCYVDLRWGKQRKNALVHRLVGKYFIPNPEKKPTINHKDANKANNQVSNLEWATHRENNLHARRLGLIKPVRGERAGHRTLSLDTVRKIRAALSKDRYTHLEIAAMFSTNYSNVAHIKRGSRWQYDY